MYSVNDGGESRHEPCVSCTGGAEEKSEGRIKNKGASGDYPYPIYRPFWSNCRRPGNGMCANDENKYSAQIRGTFTSRARGSGPGPLSRRMRNRR